MRVERIGDAILYNADCRDILADLEYDVVVTDPPYGTEVADDGSRRGYGRNMIHNPGKGLAQIIANDANLDCCFEVLNILAQRPSGQVALFHSARNLKDFYYRLRDTPLRDALTRELIWNKRAPGLGVGWFHYYHEHLTIIEWGNVPAATHDLESVIEESRNPKHHPHQKPDGIMAKLVQFVSGETVLDPFCGSGSTGVACVSLKKHFIGIELDEGHFETACRRIAEATKQGGLF